MQNTRKVTDDIVWVGCNDRRLTLFENLFPIPRGVSYNSYLVMDEKVTLLDTVDVCALQQFMENIDYVLDGKEIDYLIVQHMEPDHGAGIQEMMRRFPNMKIVANAKTIQMIGQFFDLPQEDRVVLVKEGDKKPIIITINDEGMELQIDSQIGSMKEDIDINKMGKDIMIGFNPKFLIDALKVIDDEEIHIYLMNPKAPCFIRDDAGQYVYLILPVNFNSVGR